MFLMSLDDVIFNPMPVFPPGELKSNEHNMSRDPSSVSRFV